MCRTTLKLNSYKGIQATMTVSQLQSTSAGEHLSFNILLFFFFANESAVNRSVCINESIFQVTSNSFKNSRRKKHLL